MQLAKGVRRREHTYLVALKEGKDQFLNVLEEVLQVLDEYGDVMSPELSKKLFPRREVDHVIVLESGAKPPSGSLL